MPIQLDQAQTSNECKNQSEFQNGIYFLRINIGGVQKVERLIIQN
jgi:hypothetical protein